MTMFGPRAALWPALFLLGIALRLVLATTFTGIQADPQFYDLLSNSVAAGDGLKVFVPQYGELSAGYPPLYPLLLGMWKFLGGPAVLLNTLIDLVASWLIYRISRSPLAALIYFLFPSVLISSLLPLKEGLAVMLVLASMCVINRSLPFGAVAGLIALTQPAWLPLPAVAFALARRTADWPAAFAAGCAVMAPWWIRNWMLFGQFVPLTTSTGLSLYVAATGQYLPIDGALLEPLRSSQAAQLALQVIAQDPVGYLLRVAKSLARAFVYDDAAIQALHWTTAGWLTPALVISQACWFALAGGALWSRQIDRLTKFYLIAGGVTVFLGIWLEFGARHRAFLVPLLTLIAVNRLAKLPNGGTQMSGPFKRTATLEREDPIGGPPAL